MSPTRDHYLLSRGEDELIRMNRQHEVYKKYIYDGRMIYDPSVELGGDAKILDAGTGSGAYVLDLARQAPANAQLFGVDVSDGSFPKTGIPSNVHLLVTSVLSLPDEWSNQFDFIHQRLLRSGLLTKEWPVVLSNYLNILKPGGHIQLCEVACRTLELSGPAGRTMCRLYEQLAEKRGTMSDCAMNLPLLLKRAGFVNIRADLKLLPCTARDASSEEGKAGMDAVVGAYRSMRGAFVQAGLVEDEETMLELIDNLEKEWEEVGFCSTKTLVIAQKPV